MESNSRNFSASTVETACLESPSGYQDNRAATTRSRDRAVEIGQNLNRLRIESLDRFQ
jgi:hypothetical protein